MLRHPSSNTRPDHATAELTVYTNAHGLLGKRLWLDDAGKLAKESVVTMSSGTARREWTAGPQDLADLIATLRFDQALSIGSLARTGGIPDDGTPITVISKQAPKPLGAWIHREKMGGTCIFPPDRPGWVLLDFDTDGMPGPVAAILAGLGGFVPALLTIALELRTAAIVTRASSSSGLWYADAAGNRVDLPGSTGQHAYVLLADGAAAPEFLAELHMLCWANGLGWFKFAKDGSLLERSIVDRSVASPERLIFEGTTKIDPPLRQDERRCMVQSGRPLAPLALSADLAERAADAIAQARAALEPERKRRSRKWVNQEVALRRAKHAELNPDDLNFVALFNEKLERRMLAQRRRGKLYPGTTLHFDDGRIVDVGDVLANPSAFHEAALADPMEGPDYGRCKARFWANADGTRIINSFAHGGRHFELLPPLTDDAAGTQGGTPLGTSSEARDPEPAKVSSKARKSAVPDEPDVASQGEFMLRYVAGPRGERPGIYRHVKVGNAKVWVWFASLIEVRAWTRDHNSDGWGRLLAVHDVDGTVHEWAMAASMLNASGDGYRAKLHSLGAIIPTDRTKRGWLAEYLSVWSSDMRQRSVGRVGWHPGPVFVLPDRTFGSTNGENVVLQAAGAPPIFTLAGSLHGWQDGVGRYCVGNSRLALVCSASFAGPLLHPLGEANGGLHLISMSSQRKTAALHLARSVWGVPMQSWRATDNAAEHMAYAACDAALCVDEISQGTAQAVDALGYMLANGRGKVRLERDGTPRPVLEWRSIVLSSGEQSFADKLAEEHRRAKVGQAMRIVEVRACRPGGHGIYETMHGFTNGALFSDYLKRMAEREQHGTAGRRFLELLTADVERHKGAALATRDRFLTDHCPAGADGQVRRVAGLFALFAAAGELATTMGILPWPQGEAVRACAACLFDWIEERGGVQDAGTPAEILEGIEAVRRFIAAHGKSRFEPAWLTEWLTVDDTKPSVVWEDHAMRTLNRVGFRKYVSDISTSGWMYFVIPSMWKSEICKGFDYVSIARAMRDRGWLMKGDSNNLTRTTRVPGQHDKARYYTILPEFMADP